MGSVNNCDLKFKQRKPVGEYVVLGEIKFKLVVSDLKIGLFIEVK
jgi:hypothetical protein